MKTDNPFDKKIELYKTLVLNKPERLIDSAIFVTDTLELCLASAQAVFEEEATPKLALEIYDRVVERMIELEHEINIPTPSADCCQGCSEREQKLQDENQALRDQVALLEDELTTIKNQIPHGLSYV